MSSQVVSQALSNVLNSVKRNPASLPRRANSSIHSQPSQSRPGFGIDSATDRKPRKSIVRLSRELNSKVMNSDLRKSFTTAVKVSGEFGPIVTASTKIGDWCLRQRPTEFQNLSSDEVMFIAHIYNWGLIRARQIAAKFRYTIRQPLPVLLAAMYALDRNCSAQSVKRKPLSGSPASSRKRSSTA